MPFVSSILAAAGRALADVEALALPRACLGCEAPLRAADDVCCGPCRWRMRRIAPPTCARCGQPLDAWADGRTGGLADNGTAIAIRPPDRPTASPPSCGFCRAWPPALGWAASAVWLDGPARELVHALKYGGWTCAARPMADLVARDCGARMAGADALVPIPLGRTRRRERGYNQAAVLAAALGERLGLPVREGVLRRSRETATQTAQHRSERWANVAGAFRADGRDLAGAHVVLVDDVLTTGATLAAAAAALTAAGAARVGAVTFGRALAPS